MQHNDTAGKFALLTRQEHAYLSDDLQNNSPIPKKSKLNYKIRMKLEIFEKVELPLLMRSGFELRSVSLSIENDKDCHYFNQGPNPCPAFSYLLYPWLLIKFLCFYYMCVCVIFSCHFSASSQKDLPLNMA